MSDEPEMVEDGVLTYKNVSVHVECCNEQSGRCNAYLRIGDDDDWGCNYNDVLYDRDTAVEAWVDACDWLREIAESLLRVRGFIMANGYFTMDDGCSDQAADGLEAENERLRELVGGLLYCKDWDYCATVARDGSGPLRCCPLYDLDAHEPGCDRLLDELGFLGI